MIPLTSRVYVAEFVFIPTLPVEASILIPVLFVLQAPRTSPPGSFAPLL